ncbi:MAG: flagellar hook protein, partial [Lachnospiraceae bacterium]|nr:flagellar hook protein [Lachnospiraceae bacterium]
AAGNIIATGTASGGTIDEESPEGTSQSVVITAKTITAAKEEGEVARFYDKDGNAVSANALKDYFSIAVEDPNDDESESTIYAKGGAKLYDAVGNVINLETEIEEENIVVTRERVGDLKLKLHVGADATKNNQITINLQALSGKGLGINGLKVNGKDDSNALDAIETIKAALTTVSAQRSELGAAQNRLEHTIANLDNIVENTTSAESQIRDTDMAEEMVKYSKSNILAQAGQSMLAQANQSNQGVLSLLG